MTISILRPLAVAALAFALVGCDEGRTNPPDVTVRIMNVAPQFSGLQFGREQVIPRDVPFKSGIIEGPWDEDTYDFKIYGQDIRSGDTPLKKAFRKEILNPTLYTFVLVQSGTGVQELILEADPPPATATNVQVLAAHGGENLPAMDVFLEPAGTDIAGAVPWGSLSYLGTLPAKNVAAGAYEMTLTAAGNRSSVLLTTPAFTLDAALQVVFVITPEGEDSVSPVSVTVGGGSFANLPDRNAQSAVRVINAPVDAAPRDVAFNGQFSPPLFAAVPFAAPTAFVPIAPGTDIAVNVTPPGNPGVLELDQKVSTFVTRKHTLLVYGDTGVLKHSFVIQDFRRLADEAKVTFYNAATQFAVLDLLIFDPGDSPTGAPVASLPPGSISLSVSAPPGSYDVYLGDPATNTIVAGPIPVTVAAAGFYGILATNGPDSVTATLTLIDDFQ